MQPSHETPTIDYSTLRGRQVFTRTETPEGVTFTTAPPSAVIAMALAAFPLVLLLIAAGVLFRQAYQLYQVEALKYAFRPLVGAVSVLVFLGLALVLGARAWKRRNVPICVAVLGRKLVLITPHLVEMRREIPFEDVLQIIAKPVGVSVRLEKTSDLQVMLHGHDKPIIVLHGYPRADVEFIAAELLQRLGRKEALT